MECQMGFSNISVILVDNLFEMGQFIDGQLNLMTSEVDLYRIVFWIEPNRIERFLQHLQQLEFLKTKISLYKILVKPWFVSMGWSRRLSVDASYIHDHIWKHAAAEWNHQNTQDGEKESL